MVVMLQIAPQTLFEAILPGLFRVCLENCKCILQKLHALADCPWSMGPKGLLRGQRAMKVVWVGYVAKLLDDR